MNTLRRYWLALTFVLAAFATSAALYAQLPAIIPTHWNARGIVNGWMPKWQGAFFAPCTALVLIVILVLVERWQLQEEDEAEIALRKRFFPSLVAAITGFVCYVNAVVLMAGLRRHFELPSKLAAGIGLLIIVIGNGLGKVPQNRVVGIRTPWTLANQEVWARTHRIGGWLFVLAGVVMAITGFIGLAMVPGLIALGGAVAVSVGYSYIVARRLDGPGGASS